MERRALQIGRRQAAEVFDRRAHTLAKRARALRTAGRARAAARGNAGVLVAEGDSWFDYPLWDVLKILDDDYGYDVETVAHRGDAIEEMAYGAGQLDDFARRIEKLLRRGVRPKAILLSGGGNDVAGSAFAMLLNHRRSPRAGLDPAVVDGVLAGRIEPAFVTVLAGVTQLCRRYLGASRPVPILVHGYDYPVPDGRGFVGGFSALPGPWLEPGFRAKDYRDLGERIAIAAELIDRFHRMLARVVALPAFAHVRCVDLRGTLSNGAGYRSWWSDELHPTRRGFAKVTERFASALAAL
jgi:lysophospholipase L1-like esterase